MIKWKKEEIEFLRVNRQKYTVEELSKVLNRTEKSITAKLYELGIKKDLCKLSYDKEFFKESNLLNSYWAGFLAADANIDTKSNKISINLSSKDACHLEQLRRDINFTGTVKHRTDIRIKWKNVPREYHTSTLLLSGAKKVIEDLDKVFNIGPCKSLTLLPPDNLTDENKLAYIIGLIDGDGSILLHKNDILELSCVGTKEILEWMKNIIDSSILNIYNPYHNITRQSCSKDKNCWSYKILKKKALTVLTELNKIDVPKLERKWSKIYGKA